MQLETWAEKMLHGVRPASDLCQQLFDGDISWSEFVGRETTKDERRALTRALNTLIQSA
jgi:hypothetical protein